MPKWLNFVLNFFAVVTALGYLFVLCTYPLSWMMGWKTEAEFALIPLVPFALHRLPIMLGEFIFIRPYLNGTNVNKDLFKINIYVFFGLFLSSIICASIFLIQLQRLMSSWIEWRYIGLPLMTVIAGLIGLAEVYIKTDYFMEKHLITNTKDKVTPLLSIIIISVYLLSVAEIALYVFSIKNPII